MSRVLLVDDDRDALDLRSLLFEAKGHAVATARDPDTALSAFAEFRPDSVILDLALPYVADGLGLIHALRDRSSTVKLIVLSGHAVEFERAPERALVQFNFEKPLRSETLFNALASG